MIKFFRKIRQNLLSEGKTGKYFKYAVGEIVLVVLGILIALQINNWNEKNKQEETIKNLFLEVQKDLLNDIEESNLVLEYFDNYETIISNIYNDNYTKEDYLNPKTSAELFYAGLHYYPLQISSQSYDVLNSKKDIIPKEYQELLSRLNAIYIELNHFLQRNQKNLENHSNSYEEYRHKNFDWVIDLKKRNITNEAIEYHLDSDYHKRQVVLWDEYADRIYNNVTSIKNTAILSCFMIQDLIQPNQDLPPYLKNLNYKFTINDANDFIGNYIAKSDTTQTNTIYQKHGILFWGNINNESQIYGNDARLVELGKDSIGFATFNKAVMIVVRDSLNQVIRLDGYRNNTKGVEFIKTDNK